MDDQWIKFIAKFEDANNHDQPLLAEEYVNYLSLTSMARLWDVGKSEPIKVRKASPTEGTLPGAIYFILKYKNDCIGAIKANAMVGGDNSSHSIAIGMFLGQCIVLMPSPKSSRMARAIGIALGCWIPCYCSRTRAEPEGN